jgi:MFS family permease
VIALNLLQGVVNAFDMPARQAFVVEMVERREDLPNAIALNSTIFNGARLVGPSAAGILIAAFGEGTCFLVDGFSYLAVIASLLAMRIRAPTARPRHAPFLAHLAEGFRYAFGFAPIRAIMVLLATVSLAGFPYTVLMPVFARDILDGDSHLLGFLTGAGGVGALGGALYMASRRTVLGLGKVISLAGGGFGVSLIAFSFSRWIPLSFVLMLATGFCMMVQMASSNTVLQTLVDDDKRGRVMSIYTMAFMGMAPFGSLLAGTGASALGAPATVLLGGVVCIVGAVAFASSLPTLRRLVRPIYVKRGILPEIAEGLRSATELSESGLPEE